MGMWPVLEPSWMPSGNPQVPIHVITRSVSKCGAQGAYLQCLNQMGEWLLLLYPAEGVEAKLELLQDRAPGT